MANQLINRASSPMKKRHYMLFLSSLVVSGHHSTEAFFSSSNTCSPSLTKTSNFSRGLYTLQAQQTSSPCFNNNRYNHSMKTMFTRSIKPVSSQRFSSSDNISETSQPLRFLRGDLIQVEVVRFGPLGASVEIIAHKSHEEKDLIPQDEEPIGYGLILQKEIGYFRSGRGGVDVVNGEILPAYVERVRDDGKVDITLRRPGGKGKAEDLSIIILEALQKNGEVDVGDKSSPGEINAVFPGTSKASFKRAVAALYKKKLVQPGKYTTKLM